MLTRTELDQVLNFPHTEYPIVSLYINRVPSTEQPPLDKRMKKLIKSVSDIAEDKSMPREARMSLRRDVEKLQEAVSRVETTEAPAVAIFSSADADLFFYLPLPKPVHDRVVVDADPYVRPLLAILDEYHRFCAVVVDRQHATIYEYYMGELLDSAVTVNQGVRKKDFAGYYGLQEHNVRNHAKELAHRHYREVASLLLERFKAHDFELLFIGGHTETVDEFLPFLHSYLKPLVAGTFVIDPSTMTPAKVREACERLEEEYERKQEQELVSKLLDASVREQGAVLGLQRVLDAANVAGIDTLLIHDNTVTPGVVCDHCGWLGIDQSTCPICNKDTRAVPDLIDELSEDVIAEGGLIEHVYADTSLSEHVVGAFIRFPIPQLATS